ncbi:MAG: DUF6799 domain-containing protein [Bacteroidota bacterium]
MKKITMFIASLLLSAATMAQDNQVQQSGKPAPNVMYCAKEKGGKIIVFQNKTELTVDVTLANGTTVKTDGTILKADGSQLNLTKGECADNNGEVINPKGTKK